MKLRNALDKAKRDRENHAADQTLHHPDNNIADDNQSTSDESSYAEHGSENNEIKEKNNVERAATPPKEQVNDVDHGAQQQKVIPVYSNSKTFTLDLSKVAANKGVCINPAAREIEKYKILRTKIMNKTKENNLNTIMITSANKSEGKTITAINLSFTFAKAFNQTVLLVDCDFTGQDIHRYLGLKNDISLIDYFEGNIPLQDLIIWPGVDRLSLISGNKTVLDSSEILSSHMMKDLVLEMKNRYRDRYVFFDAPPVLDSADAISIAPLVDGIIMVVEAGTTDKKDIFTAMNSLPQEKFLGFVLNRQKSV